MIERRNATGWKTAQRFPSLKNPRVEHGFTLDPK
jgi:hypothetical protein